MLPRTSLALRCTVLVGLANACDPDVDPPAALELVVRTDAEGLDLRTHVDLEIHASVGCDPEVGWSHFSVWQSNEQVAELDPDRPRPWALSVELGTLPHPPSPVESDASGDENGLVVRGHCGDGREVDAAPVPLPPSVVPRALYPTEQTAAVLTVEGEGTWLGCGGALVRSDLDGRVLATAELEQSCIFGDTVRVLDDAVIVEHGGSVEVFDRETLAPRWYSPPGYVTLDADGRGAVTATYAPPEPQSPFGWATVSRWSLIDADTAVAPIAIWDVATQVDDSAFTPSAVGWNGEHAWMIGDLLPSVDAQPRALERWTIASDGKPTRELLLALASAEDALHTDVGVTVTEDQTRALVVADETIRLIDVTDATVLFEEPQPQWVELHEAGDLWIETGDELVRLDRDGTVVARTTTFGYVGAIHPTGGALMDEVGYDRFVHRLDAALEPVWMLPRETARATGFDADGNAYVLSTDAQALFAL